MDSRLFTIDPMAASSYSLYKSAKDGEGNFVDFLLSYDSKAANDGDNSWLNKVLSQDIVDQITSPQIAQVLNFSEVRTSELFSSIDYFDTQVNMYKMQINQEMAKQIKRASIKETL